MGKRVLAHLDDRNLENFQFFFSSLADTTFFMTPYDLLSVDTSHIQLRIELALLFAHHNPSLACCIS